LAGRRSLIMPDSSDTPLKNKIFLYGPSGSGKSTVGKALADSLALPFWDLDVEIETQSGINIPEIFQREGETGFRERERQTLQAILDSGEAVIALGGGALTHLPTRDLAESYGQVVRLTAETEILVSRLQADSTHRPLLSGSPEGGEPSLEASLGQLLTRRASHYAEFPHQVDTGGLSPQAVAAQIQSRLGYFHLRSMASVKHPAYDVRVDPGGLAHLGVALQVRGLKGPLGIVTDANVGAHYLDALLGNLRAAGYHARGITIPAGESHKTLETVSTLWQALLAAGIERRSTVIALGGGVVGDLTGFAAATFLRGVSWVVLPTSLLAMVDSGLGGKTGADLVQGKNLIGAFYPPRFVMADPSTLATLPAVEWTNGMAEVLKHGIIADPGLFELCVASVGNQDPDFRAQLVSRGMAVKVAFIENDPFEKGVRAALNYGHTVGHGVELVSGYRVRHGEAVAIGMVQEARLAEHIGLADPGLADQVAQALNSLGLPVEIPASLNRDAIVAAMRRDKKVAAGEVKFALPAAIGDVRTGIRVDAWEEWVRNDWRK
jgi:shikimate kinase/3-dehydroquinate synthase